MGIEPKFDKAKAFYNNLAPVLVGKKWGFIDLKGTLVIEPTFNDAEVFSADGLAPVKENDWGFINISGKLIIPTKYGITAGGIFSIFKDDQKGFINGLARVKYGSDWGFLKPDGQVLGQWYQNAELFQK
ncbi:WG repeat-containing protein [Flavobacterium sp.]|uniref:WG repeat-containing protein n=1 Tax=Flavobacterium sp. TaxID=239 RepID=UPI0025F47A5A|nr:WG repeat-containing protein [Flavobacterium sp.]